MTTELWCLLGFAAWGLALVTSIGTWRAVLVLTRKKPASGFPSGTQHGDPLYWRLNRAHMNTLENLPLAASFILTAAVAGISTPNIVMAAQVLLGARIAQSLSHIASGSNLAVNARFTAFCVQLGCLAVIGWEIVQRAW